MAQTREEKNAARRERRRIARMNMTDGEREEMYIKLIARRRQMHWGNIFEEWGRVTAKLRGEEYIPPEEPLDERDDKATLWSERWKMITKELREGVHA